MSDTKKPAAKKKDDLPEIEESILETKAALATGGPDKEDQQERFREAIAHDTDQQNIDKEVDTDAKDRHPRAEVAEGKEAAKHNHLADPKLQAQVAKDAEKGYAEGTSTPSEHPGAKASRAADQAATEEVKPATHVDFGKAGKLKIAGHGQANYGVNGAEHSVTVEVGDEEGTFTLHGIPARFLK